MHDDQWDHLNIDYHIARARRERSQALANLLRRLFRWAWTCPECNNTRTMFHHVFAGDYSPISRVEEIPCDYPSCTGPQLLRRAWTALRHGWISMWGRWRITVQIDRVEEPR